MINRVPIKIPLDQAPDDDIDKGSRHTRFLKRDAEEDVLLNRSSPRPELKDPSPPKLIWKDEVSCHLKFREVNPFL